MEDDSLVCFYYGPPINHLHLLLFSQIRAAQKRQMRTIVGSTGWEEQYVDHFIVEEDGVKVKKCMNVSHDKS